MVNGCGQELPEQLDLEVWVWEVNFGHFYVSVGIFLLVSHLNTLVFESSLNTVSSLLFIVVAVGASGSSYITGYLSGTLNGESNNNVGVVVLKYDASGNVLWTRLASTTIAGFGYGGKNKLIKSLIHMRLFCK